MTNAKKFLKTQKSTKALSLEIATYLVTKGYLHGLISHPYNVAFSIDKFFQEEADND